MTSELQIPVSVKVRIGVDAHDSYHFFRDFVARLHQEGGCDRFVIHARKALLNGLPDGVSAPQPSSRGAVTTKQNRLAAIVPLRYEYVHRLKAELPHLRIEINGGIRSIADVHAATAGGLLDGVMLGRLARDDPWFFASVDSALFGERDAFEGLAPLEARLRVIEQYADYCEGEQKDGHETWDGRDPNPRT